MRRRSSTATNDINDSGSIRSNRSNTSKRSRISAGYQRGDARSFDTLLLRHKWKYWMFPLIEFCVSFSWKMCSDRCARQSVLAKRNMTNLQASNEILMWRSVTSLFCPVVGFFIDEFTGSYAVAIFNVAMQFSLTSLFAMNSIIQQKTVESHYDKWLAEIFNYYTIPVLATNFTRILYAFDQSTLTDFQRHAHLTCTLMIARLSGDLSYWGAEQILDVEHSEIDSMVFLAFGASGLALFVIVYVLTPTQVSSDKFISSSATRAWGCVIKALIGQFKNRKYIKNAHWLDYADFSVNHMTIVQTKALMRVLMMVVPPAGYMMLMISRDTVYDNFSSSLKYTDDGAITLVTWIVTLSPLLTMLIVQYGILILTRVFNVKLGFLNKFILGYLLVITSLFFVTVAMTSLEKTQLRTNLGIVRIYNTRQQPVGFYAKDDENLELNFTMPPNGPTNINFFTSRSHLFHADFTFNNRSKYTRLLYVQPFAVKQYLIVEPHVVVGIQGVLPLRYGYPGNNDVLRPRVMLVNLISSNQGEATFRNLKTKVSEVSQPVPKHRWEFQPKEGKYEITMDAVPTLSIKSYLGAGGLYVVILYTDMKEIFLVLDVVNPPNTASYILRLGESVPFAMSCILSYAPLWSLIYLKSPEGLAGTTLSFLTLTESMTAFPTLIGQLTWHEYYTSVTLTVYSFLMSGGFVLSLCLFLQLKPLYKYMNCLLLQQFD